MWLTLTHALVHFARTSPDFAFLHVLEKGEVRCTRTYAQAWRRAGDWAGAFAGRGIARGQAALLALPDDADFAEACFGALLAGVVPVPVAPIRRAEHDDPYLAVVAERLRFVEARALVVPDETAAVADLRPLSRLPQLHVITPGRVGPSPERAAPQGSGDDLALIQFTSGTAGRSKAVRLTHRALLAQIEGLSAALRLVDRTRDWGLSWLPLYHDMGLIGFLFTPAVHGGTLYLMSAEEFILRPAAWPAAITRFRPSIVGGPPSAYALCARRVRDAELAHYDLSSVRIALVGAEMVTEAALSEFARKFGPAGFRESSLMPTYGLAENALAVSLPPLDRGPRFDSVDVRRLAEGVAEVWTDEAAPKDYRRRIASVGAPLPHTEIAVVDASGRHLPERRVGEIVVRSPSRMQGYHAQPDASAEALRDGWLWTGDLGYLAGGELHITGRKKEIVVVGGRNYFPDDAEGLAGAVPGVRAGRAVVFSVDDPARATEAMVVLVETALTDPAERDGLRLRLRQALSRAGYPVGEVVLARPKTIPSTLNGKTMRVECKARYLAGAFDGRQG